MVVQKSDTAVVCLILLVLAMACLMGTLLTDTAVWTPLDAENQQRAGSVAIDATEASMQITIEAQEATAQPLRQTMQAQDAQETQQAWNLAQTNRRAEAELRWSEIWQAVALGMLLAGTMAGFYLVLRLGQWMQADARAREQQAQVARPAAYPQPVISPNGNGRVKASPPTKLREHTKIG